MQTSTIALAAPLLIALCCTACGGDEFASSSPGASAGSSQAGSSQAGSAQAGSAQAGSGQGGSAQGGSSQGGSAQASAGAGGGSSAQGGAGGEAAGGQVGGGGAGGVEAGVDLTGKYEVDTVAGDNGCELKDWMAGGKGASIPLTMTQSGADLTCTIEGLAGFYIKLLLGSDTLNGGVSGASFTLEGLGNVQSQKTCDYRWKVSITGEAIDKFVKGDIVYEPEIIKETADCGVLSSCKNTQSFDGKRVMP